MELASADQFMMGSDIADLPLAEDNDLVNIEQTAEQLKPLCIVAPVTTRRTVPRPFHTRTCLSRKGIKIEMSKPAQVPKQRNT